MQAWPCPESRSTGKNNQDRAWWDLYCELPEGRSHVTEGLMPNTVLALTAAWLMFAELLNERVMTFTTEAMEDHLTVFLKWHACAPRSAGGDLLRFQKKIVEVPFI